MPAKKKPVYRQPLKIFLQQADNLTPTLIEENTVSQALEQTENLDTQAITSTEEKQLEAAQPKQIQEPAQGVHTQSTLAPNQITSPSMAEEIYSDQTGEIIFSALHDEFPNSFDSSNASKYYGSSFFSEPPYASQTTANITTPEIKSDYLVLLPKPPTTEQPEETKTNVENSEIEDIIMQIQSTYDESFLDAMYNIAQQEKLVDLRIYNALIIAAYNCNRPDLITLSFDAAEKLLATNTQTYNIIIEISGKRKERQNVAVFYEHLKRRDWANDKSYLMVIEALIRCGEPKAAWDFYSTEVPQEIKATHWEIHEAIMSMARFFSPENTTVNIEIIKFLLQCATKAYDNAIAANLNIDYDIVHAKMLKIALAYDLIEEFAEGIYVDAVSAKTNGSLTDAAYSACLQRREEILQSDIQKQLQQNNMNQATARSSNYPAASLVYPSTPTIPATTSGSQSQSYYTQGGYTHAVFQQSPIQRTQYQQYPAQGQQHPQPAQPPARNPENSRYNSHGAGRH